MPAGRPSGYDPKRHPKLANSLCLLGATDAEIADAFQINQDSLYEWQRSFPEFSESIARGKLEADAKMAKALYHRGLGAKVPAVKIFMPAGASEPVYAPYIEHYPPDTAAASLWLRNRRGANRKKDQAIQWSERIEHTGADGGPISLEALLARADDMPGDAAKLINAKADQPTTEPDKPALPAPPGTPTD